MNIVDAPKTKAGGKPIREMRNDIDRRGKRILSAVAQCRRTAVSNESKQRGSYASAGNCAFACGYQGRRGQRKVGIGLDFGGRYAE